MNIPLLGTFLLAAQKMLPSVNLFYINFNNILANHSQVIDVLKFLKEEKKVNININNNSNLKFEKKIKLEKINFSYSTNNSKIDVLKNFSLEINKGEKIAIIGKSGSGKSTLMDIIMGLINCSEGIIKSDDIEINEKNIKSWRKKFSHVSQKIFLIKETIKNNIILSKKDAKFDQDLFNLSLKVSGSKFVNYLEEKENSDVGEDGSLLSGGQRQRIGIARSIYDNTEILTFDEATSALDNELQSEVYKNLSKYLFDKTFIAITHDINQLKHFDKIIHLKENYEYEIKKVFKKNLS